MTISLLATISVIPNLCFTNPKASQGVTVIRLLILRFSCKGSLSWILDLRNGFDVLAIYSLDITTRETMHFCLLRLLICIDIFMLHKESIHVILSFWRPGTWDQMGIVGNLGHFLRMANENIQNLTGSQEPRTRSSLSLELHVLYHMISEVYSFLTGLFNISM
jgi:hypothetical protein